MVECLPCRSRGKLFHHQVCDVWRHWWHSKIPDITWDVGHSFNLLIMYYVRGFAWAWMALRARNASPSGRATFDPQSTRHGPRPGANLAYWVRAGSLCATGPRARGKTRGRNRKYRRVTKTHFFKYMYILRTCIYVMLPGNWYLVQWKCDHEDETRTRLTGRVLPYCRRHCARVCRAFVCPG